MIAHSFEGERRRPSSSTAPPSSSTRRSGSELDDDGILDIGLATEQVHDVVGALSYRNLDDDPSSAATPLPRCSPASSPTGSQTALHKGRWEPHPARSPGSS